MRVRLRGPLAEYELRHWSLREPGDAPERFPDAHVARSLLRRIVGESSSFGLRTLVERLEGPVLGFVDEGELIERLASALVRGTIVVVRTPHSIIETYPPARIESVYEPLEPTPFEEPESVWLSASHEVEWLALSVSAEPESLDLETSHHSVGG